MVAVCGTVAGGPACNTAGEGATRGLHAAWLKLAAAWSAAQTGLGRQAGTAGVGTGMMIALNGCDITVGVHWRVGCGRAKR